MIRKARLEDIVHITAMEFRLFSSDAWSMADFMYEYDENPYATIWVVEEDDCFMGYCDVWVTFEQAQIATIGVDVQYQGQGYGKILLQHAQQYAYEQGCETMSLEVRISNEVAIGLYTRCGFETINIKKEYYKDNYEDAYFMMKALGGNDETNIYTGD